MPQIPVIIRTMAPLVQLLVVLFVLVVLFMGSCYCHGMDHGMNREMEHYEVILYKPSPILEICRSNIYKITKILIKKLSGRFIEYTKFCSDTIGLDSKQITFQCIDPNFLDHKMANDFVNYAIVSMEQVIDTRKLFVMGRNAKAIIGLDGIYHGNEQQTSDTFHHRYYEVNAEAYPYIKRLLRYHVDNNMNENTIIQIVDEITNRYGKIFRRDCVSEYLENNIMFKNIVAQVIDSFFKDINF